MRPQNRYKFPTVAAASLTVAVVLWAGVTQAQPDFYKQRFEHDRDSALTVLKQHPNPDTGRAIALVNLLDCAPFLSEKKQVLPYWQEAIRLSRQLKFKTTEAVCLEWMGGFYKSQMKYDSALLYLDSGIRAATPSSNDWLRRTRGFAWFQEAMIREGQENYYKALNGYFEALKSYNDSDFVKQKMVFIRIASIYGKLFNDEKSLEYYQAALDRLKRLTSKGAKVRSEGIYSNIATIYFNRGDIKKAKYYVGELTSGMPDTVETLVTGGYYQLMGQIALKEKRTDSAIYFLGLALKYFDYTRPMHMDAISNVCADMTRLQLAAGRTEEARRYAMESLDAANKSGHKGVIAGALIAMAEYDNRIGDHSGAYEALRRATALNDSVLVAANIKQANTLAAIYESDKQEKEIARLESDEKTQAAAVRQHTLLNILFIIVIIALAAISFVLYLNFRNKRRLERQRILELEKEKQLMGIEAMLKGQEEERSRLARELHDGLGSMLSGVKISLSNLRDHIEMTPANSRVFDKTLERLDATIADLRKAAHNLMPEALVRFGLRDAVKDFCESMRRTNIEIICEQFGTERDLGNIADINVYRIVQELINNAVNHGKAARILVQLTKTTDKTLITVEDDGKGFDTGILRSASGIGWSNIRSRVNYFSGIIDIESTPGEGTIINIELAA